MSKTEDVFIGLPEVIRKTSLSRAHIYRLEQIGAFPRRVRIGARRVAWSESEIVAWQQQKMRQRADCQVNP